MSSNIAAAAGATPCRSVMRSKASARRLGDIVAGGDVANVLEQMQHAELVRHALGVAARAVGEDERAAGQRGDRRRQLGRLAARRKDRCRARSRGTACGSHFVHLHQARQRRAELAVVGLLQMPRVLEGHAEVLGDEVAHALVDLGEEVAVGGIERVVEIEDPDAACRRSRAALPSASTCDRRRARAALHRPCRCGASGHSRLLAIRRADRRACRRRAR